MECPLWRLHISSRSVNKHSHHRPFFFSCFLLLHHKRKTLSLVDLKTRGSVGSLSLCRSSFILLWENLIVDASYQVSAHLARQFTETHQPNELKRSRKRLWKGLYKDCPFHPDPLPNMATTGNSCFWLANFKKSPPLKPLGQINLNLVGSIYGMSSMKIAQFVPIGRQT
jgi:hypothetical protein